MSESDQQSAVSDPPEGSWRNTRRLRREFGRSGLGWRDESVSATAFSVGTAFALRSTTRSPHGIMDASYVRTPKGNFCESSRLALGSGYRCFGNFRSCESLGSGQDRPVRRIAGPGRARATEFLIAAQQADGSWTSEKQPGITGLVTFALLEAGVKPDHPAIEKALKHLSGYTQPDGGIYHPETAHKNYETSITLLAFRRANVNGKYDELLKKALEFLRSIQWDEAEGADPSQPAYGGQGYGRSKRPDLSNTAFFLEALKESGVPGDDEAVKKAWRSSRAVRTWNRKPTRPSSPPR